MKNPKLEERHRLEVLETYGILDSGREEVFDRLADLARVLCDTPIATITMVDEKRQWFKSILGLALQETARSISFCTHTVDTKKPFVVHDALKDPAFRHNPLVTGDPKLRFYAGVPLICPKGFALGTLAVMDRVPRTLSEHQMKLLSMLAEQVVVNIELRRQQRQIESMAFDRDRINSLLVRQSQQLREAQRIAQVGSWELHIGAGQLYCSDEIYRMFGVPQNQESETLASFMKSVHFDDQEALEKAISKALADKTVLDAEHRIVRPGREIRYVHTRGEYSVRNDGQEVLYGTVQDITEQHLAEQQLRLLNECISRINDIVMITEANALDEPGPRIIFVNEAFEKITGYSYAEAAGRSPRFLQGPNTSQEARAQIRVALNFLRPVKTELINYAKDGREFWLEIDIVPIFDSRNRATHFVGINRDITQRKRAEAEVERLAFYDQLTHLPNRRLLLNRAQQALAAVARGGTIGALLFIDLDNFKNLNDTLGHDKGDQLLHQVARRLERSVRRYNTVSRFGGDEFVILLENLGSDRRTAASHAELIGENVLAAFRQSFDLGGSEHRCTPSVGIALFDDKTGDIDELLKHADMAMYQAKSAGRNSIRFFDPAMQAIVQARVTLEHELHRAMDQQQFVLYYQPQADAHGHVTGVEALIRWQHPRNGLVSPASFIALAEETGLISRIGFWVIETACRQLVQWANDHRTASLNIALNVSTRQFRHPEFAARAISLIEASGANPARLKFELTENVLADDTENAIAKMSALKACGVGFSLDDFGTGYSSLSCLKKMPLDQIKIDRSFVRDILTDQSDAAIARTILALGASLGLQVMAEGVETEDQRAFLVNQGCHAFQGYLFSCPLPADQIPSANFH